MTPEFANQRLAGRPFLAPTDPAVADIIRRICALRRPDDGMDIPSPEGAGAWDRLYGRYCWLRDRAAREEAAAAQHGPPANAVENERWNKFLRDREDVLMLVARNVFDLPLLEYLGLHASDLDDPVLPEPNKYGSSRVSDWRARASRLADVFVSWGCLNDEERAVLKLKRVERKLKEQIK